MKKHRKVQYFVQDCGSLKFWWHRGDWHQEVYTDSKYIHFNINGNIQRIGNARCGTIKSCRNFGNALYYARRLLLKGGNPIITRRVLKKGYWYCKDEFDFTPPEGLTTIETVL